MTKKELIAAVAEETELSKKNVEMIFSAIFDAIKNALANEDKIAIKGFGTFSVKQRAARTGRHPATGESLKIPARTVPFFSAGSDLKNVVANGAPKKAAKKSTKKAAKKTTKKETTKKTTKKASTKKTTKKGGKKK